MSFILYLNWVVPSKTFDFDFEKSNVFAGKFQDLLLKIVK